MSSIDTLTQTEAGLATARGLLNVALLLHEVLEPEDWSARKDDFGHLLIAMSGTLAGADRSVGTLYREHFAANANGRRA